MNKQKNKFCIQRVERNIPKMFQIVPCHYRLIQKISWKSIHPFYSNIANRHPAAPGWAGCLLPTLCRARYIIKMFYDVVTKTISWNRQKSILDPRDYSQHPENVLDGSLANALTFLKISWNLFFCFCVIMLTLKGPVPYIYGTHQCG